MLYYFIVYFCAISWNYIHYNKYMCNAWYMCMYIYMCLCVCVCVRARAHVKYTYYYYYYYCCYHRHHCTRFSGIYYLVREAKYLKFVGQCLKISYRGHVCNKNGKL